MGTIAMPFVPPASQRHSSVAVAVAVCRSLHMWKWVSGKTKQERSREMGNRLTAATTPPKKVQATRAAHGVRFAARIFPNFYF